jgi:hypothetical protein
MTVHMLLYSLKLFDDNPSVAYDHGSNRGIPILASGRPNPIAFLAQKDGGELVIIGPETAAQAGEQKSSSVSVKSTKPKPHSGAA